MAVGDRSYDPNMNGRRKVLRDIEFRRQMKLLEGVGRLVLVHLKEDYIVTDYAYILDTTYAHITRTLKDLEEFGLIESVKTGRTRRYRYTALGKKFAIHLRAVDNALIDLLRERTRQKK